MDWLITFVTVLALLVVLSPLLMLLVTVFVLVPLAHLAPRPTMIARNTFDCPFSKRRATAAFLASPGVDRPIDVLACSVFADGRIRCKKGCLALAATGWTPSPTTVPRYAMIAGGTSYR